MRHHIPLEIWVQRLLWPPLTYVKADAANRSARVVYRGTSSMIGGEPADEAASTSPRHEPTTHQHLLRADTLI